MIHDLIAYKNSYTYPVQILSSLNKQRFFSSQCQRVLGMSIYRRSSAVKITIFITIVFTLTMYQFYSAMLVSTLLREPPKTIHTLTDLLDSNLDIGVEDVLYNKDYFKVKKRRT